MSQTEEPVALPTPSNEPVFFTPHPAETARPPLAPPPQETVPSYRSEEQEQGGVQPFRPQFSEVPLYIPNREYTPDFNNDGHGQNPQDEQPAQQPAATTPTNPTNFPDSYDEAQKDLDVPAFMRRLRF
jgi:hypothetical protein